MIDFVSIENKLGRVDEMVKGFKENKISDLMGQFLSSEMFMNEFKLAKVYVNGSSGYFKGETNDVRCRLLRIKLGARFSPIKKCVE
jgi:hypothetical protein